jgi:hypothetical protein
VRIKGDLGSFCLDGKFKNTKILSIEFPTKLSGVLESDKLSWFEYVETCENKVELNCPNLEYLRAAKNILLHPCCFNGKYEPDNVYLDSLIPNTKYPLDNITITNKIDILDLDLFPNLEVLEIEEGYIESIINPIRLASISISYRYIKGFSKHILNILPESVSLLITMPLGQIDTALEDTLMLDTYTKADTISIFVNNGISSEEPIKFKQYQPLCRNFKLYYSTPFLANETADLYKIAEQDDLPLRRTKMKKSARS